MQLWVGLGNPGPRYAMHRHNIGFMVCDVIAEMHGFGPVQKKFRAGVGRPNWHREGALAQARHLYEREWARRRRGLAVFKLETDALTVFHDELDLAPFKVKVKQGGGTAGHNGLRSIDQHLGKEFRRVQIGIGHPGHKDRVTSHVLGNYAKAEQDDLIQMLGGIGAEAEWLATGDNDRFMSNLAMRLAE